MEPNCFLGNSFFDPGTSFFLGLNFMGLMQSLSTFSVWDLFRVQHISEACKGWGYFYHPVPGECSGWKSREWEGQRSPPAITYYEIFDTKAGRIFCQHFASSLMSNSQCSCALLAQVNPVSVATRTAKIQRMAWLAQGHMTPGWEDQGGERLSNTAVHQTTAPVSPKDLPFSHVMMHLLDELTIGRTSGSHWTAEAQGCF